jgi:type I restriction enzyme R subunit
MESEAETRSRRIDGRLQAAGWPLRPWREGLDLARAGCCALTEFPTASGPADYALVDAGRVVGIVEAKKAGRAAYGVLTQSERYSRGVAESPAAYGEYRVPFHYSTNGETIWFEDVRLPQYRSRELAGFHTPAALREAQERSFDDVRAWFAANPNHDDHLRDYQRDANDAVEQAIVSGKRTMLVAMATGTGKTYTTISQIYRLIRSKAARRVLFLVDRRALAAQAARAFASYEPEPNLKFDRIYPAYTQRFHQGDLEEGESFKPEMLPRSFLEHPSPSHTYVYVCTIQRMALDLAGPRGLMLGSGDDDIEEAEGPHLDIPINAFDVVIADECHRGYTSAERSIWRSVLDHFDAIRIGLTATPAAHTTAYFKDVVYRYEYERAVREGHLVDYDLVKVASGVRMHGVFLREGEQVEKVDPETGSRQLDLLEEEREYDASEIERQVTAPDSNRRVLREVLRYALQREKQSGHFPKTLIFAAGDQEHTSHADQLVQLCREELDRGDAFVEKITGKVDRPLQRIREFRNRPQPGVAVTVDLLSTGVDIPALEQIVFLRPVKSRILWEQMLGRGTRLCEEIHKSHFTVFDCFDGSLFEYFRNASAFTLEPPDKPARTLSEVIEDIWQNRDREYNTRVLVKRLGRIEKEMSGDARADFAAFIPDGDVGAFAAVLPAALQQGFMATMQVLRDRRFQDLCVSYKRPPRSFLVAAEQEDTVSSEYLFRLGDGSAVRPEDYLAAFARFVREHEDDVDAIAVLLRRPSGWDTAVLRELRQKLQRTPERFSEQSLRRAYGRELADIISMVKRAAREDAPLLTAAERAARAVAAVSQGRNLTDEQRLWLQRIELQLAETLAVEREQFDLVPIFADHGGWVRANRAFDGQLEALLRRCNEAMAA